MKFFVFILFVVPLVQAQATSSEDVAKSHLKQIVNQYKCEDKFSKAAVSKSVSLLINKNEQILQAIAIHKGGELVELSGVLSTHKGLAKIQVQHKELLNALTPVYSAFMGNNNLVAAQDPNLDKDSPPNNASDASGAMSESEYKAMTQMSDKAVAVEREEKEAIAEAKKNEENALTAGKISSSAPKGAQILPHGAVSGYKDAFGNMLYTVAEKLAPRPGAIMGFSEVVTFETSLKDGKINQFQYRESNNPTVQLKMPSDDVVLSQIQELLDQVKQYAKCCKENSNKNNANANNSNPKCEVQESASSTAIMLPFAEARNKSDEENDTASGGAINNPLSGPSSIPGQFGGPAAKPKAK